jgi:ubiquinone/menaquinone biosynthesis C-methylase UbiE
MSASIQGWQIHFPERRGTKLSEGDEKFGKLTSEQREANRLDLQHHLFAKTFGNRLYFAPLNEPRNALDIGTGTGIWAIEFADEFPNCHVVGTDLSPGQPTL